MARTHNKAIIIPSFFGGLFLRCYVNTNFANLFQIDCPEDSTSANSHTSFITSLGQCHPIWKSYQQTEAFSSTLEAEYSALSTALRVSLPHINIYRQAVSIFNVPTIFKRTFHNSLLSSKTTMAS